MTATTTPILVLIDVQREYTTPGRPYCLNGIEPSLDACRQLLAHARSNGWDVVHIQHLQAREPFLEGGEFAQFVPGFEPADGEERFSKAMPSSMSSVGFNQKVFDAKAAGRRLVLAGYGGTMCCLSTAVDAMHAGARAYWVHDASLSRASAIAPEAEVHRHITEVMRIYSDVVSVAQILDGSVLAA